MRTTRNEIKPVFMVTITVDGRDYRAIVSSWFEYGAVAKAIVSMGLPRTIEPENVDVRQCIR